MLSKRAVIEDPARFFRGDGAGSAGGEGEKEDRRIPEGEPPASADVLWGECVWYRGPGRACAVTGAI
jgi:hypothetical protein